MKFLKKLTFFTAVVFVISVMLSAAYIFRPDMADKVEAFFHPEQKSVEVLKREDSAKKETSSHPDEGMELETGETQEPGETQETGQRAAEPETDARETGSHGAIAEAVVSDYVMPERSEIVVPENVSGRNGYQQIQNTSEQIDDKAAEELQNRIGTGDTGDGLDFDAVRHPYYAMLDEGGKDLYRQLYANARDVRPAFAPVVEITPDQLKNVFYAVYNDHPELFWLDAGYSYKYMGDGRCVEISLKFNRTAQNVDGARAAFEENARQIVSQAQNLPNDYEKEKFVHDQLIDKVSYNLGAELNQSAYSALVNGQTVCAGYARAMQYMLQQLGIPCYYCTGYAGEAHAWNIVALDDGYYNVDATWDDSGGGRYDYFNKTDADYASSHIRQELSVYLPPCNGSSYRNLEQNPEDASLRSIADLGVMEDQVLRDMDSYYRDCYGQFLQNGWGTYTFYNVIEGEQLLEEWYREHQAERYRQAYVDEAMMNLGASSCEMKWEVEELRGGKFLISHWFSVGS